MDNKEFKIHNDGMYKALNKIADIIDDISIGVACLDESCRDFLRGYLFALKESDEITQREYLYLIKFYDRLIDHKKFIAE